MPPIGSLTQDPALRDILSRHLPINIEGFIGNGGIKNVSAKHRLDS
jgi:hypothetical protein